MDKPFLSRALDECPRRLGTEELDIRLATEVFGWTHVPKAVNPWKAPGAGRYYSAVPRFTRDLQEIAKAMERRWPKLSLKVEVNGDTREGIYKVQVYARVDGRAVAAWGDTEAMTRCIVAAMLKERETPLSRGGE